MYFNCGIVEFKMENRKSFLIETILTMFEMAQSIIITSAMSSS